MASTLTSSLVVRLIDQVTAPARGVTRSILGIEKASNQPVGSKLSAAMERNERSLDRARMGMVDAVAGFYALRTAMWGPIQSAMDFESAMADVAKVSGFDDAGLDEYARKLRRLSTTEIPMAVNDLAALSAAAAQAGVPDEDLFDFTRLTAKAAVAWELSGATAGEALAKIRTALQLTNAETAAFADAINHVSDSTAASAPDLIDFTKRVAAQGEFFGLAKEQTLAFGAAMIASGFGADVAATSFRNMGRALTRGESATTRMRGAYKTLGLDAVKVAKAMQKDAVGTTMKVIEKLGELPDHMQASVMSDLFGDEAQALIPLVGNLDQLREALALTADEQKYLNSVGEEFEKRADTSAYKLQRFKSQLSDIALTIGGALLPAMNNLIGPLGQMALKLSSWTEANPELVRNILAATAAVVGFRIAVASIRFAGLIGKGGVLSMLSLGFNTVGKASIGAVTAARNAAALQTALGAMSGAKLSGFQAITTALRGMALAIPGVAGIGAALTAVGGALAAVSAPVWGAVAAGVAVVAAAGALLWKYWDRVSSVLSGVGRAIGEQLAPAFEFAKPYVEAFAPLGDAIAAGWNKASDALSGFIDWIGSFFQKEVLNDQQKAEWENAGYEAATRMIEAIKSVFSGLVAWAADIGGRIGDAIASRASAAINRVKSFFGGGGDTPAAANENTPTPKPAGSTPAAGVSGHRKRGGPVWPGGSFLVGEEQPEVFTPKTGGTITPLSQAGGTVTVNVGDLHFHGIKDEADFSRKVKGVVEDAMREAVRGVHADMGAR